MRSETDDREPAILLVRLPLLNPMSKKKRKGRPPAGLKGRSEIEALIRAIKVTDRGIERTRASIISGVVSLASEWEKDQHSKQNDLRGLAKQVSDDQSYLMYMVQRHAGLIRRYQRALGIPEPENEE